MENVVKYGYAECLDALVNDIVNRKAGGRHLIIVPDVYTFTVEKRVFDELGGAFDVEITTFNRLFKRNVFVSGKAIARQGAVMILKKICHETELQCYGSSAKKAGFAEKLYDAINKLRSCSITPQMLLNASSEKKIQDIACLYQKFIDATAGKFVDAGGRVALINQAVKDGAFSGCSFYIALYDVITPETAKLIKTLNERCSLVKVYSVNGDINYKVTAKISVVSCENAVIQYKEIAKKIKSYMYQNADARYSDVAVIDETGENAVMKRIFNEYSIPYFVTEKINLSSTQLYRFINGVLDACFKGYRQADMIALAKNFYFGFSIDEQTAFTAFVKRRCVNYLGFTAPFDDEVAENVRVKIISVLDAFGNKPNTPIELAQKIRAVMDLVGAQEKTNVLNEKEFAITETDRNLGQIYDKTIEIIELFVELFGGNNVFDELIDTLNEGFASTEISVVPNRSDTVTVAPTSAFRGQRIKRAFIVNFNDGILPKCIGESGLILDSDADKLSDYEINVTPKVAQKNRTLREELWKMLDVCEKIDVYYSSADGMKKSYDLKQLLSANEHNEITFEKLAFERENLTDPLDIAISLGNRTDAIESVYLNARLPYANMVRRALGEKEFEFTLEDFDRIENAKELFFGLNRVSVSALQTYFSCPYSFFMRYGLKIKEVDDGEVNVLDVGQLLHKFVEFYVLENLPDDTEHFVTEKLAIVLKLYEKYNYGANEKILNRLKTEAVKLCRIAKEHLNAGNFTPLGAEISFGGFEENQLNTIDIDGIALMGEIDRIDVNGDYARVIDYKTGTAKFSFSDLYFGKKIQLSTYMKVVMENGYKPAGFFYFPFSTSWVDDEYSNRLDGPVNTTNDNIYMHDNGLRFDKKSKVLALSYNPDPTKSQNSKAVSEEDLRDMADYSVAVARQAINEIKSGNIALSPAGEDRKSACDFCKYIQICGQNVARRNCKGAGLDEIKGALR